MLGNFRLTRPTRASADRPRTDGQMAAEEQAPAPQGSSYWAFISYSRSDERWARSLHRKLEAYRIPRDVQPDAAADIPSPHRLRPVFRDDDELAASADLGARLRAALDSSRYLIVLASRAAAASRWVNAEAAHFVEAGRTDDVLVLVVDGEPGDAPDREALPAAIRQLPHELLWLDAREQPKPERKTFLRLVAGMLQVSFDALWQRDRRRRWRLLALWTAVAVLLSAVTGGAIWQGRRAAETAAEANKPQRQIAAFRQFLTADLVKSAREFDHDFDATDVAIDIVRTDDLNGDSLVDFFVFNKTSGWCGSGGCAMKVYLSEGHGKYSEVLDLFGSSTPRTRTGESGGYKEIVATHYSIDAEPVYTVFRWARAKYELSHYEFCNGILIEYCEPTIVTPVDDAESLRLKVSPDAPYLRRPEDSAPWIEESVRTPRVIGRLADRDWYLVDAWKGRSGFVRRSDVTRA
jgi:hypothetical protein